MLFDSQIRHSCESRNPEIVDRIRGMTGVLLIFTPTLSLSPTTICNGEGICEIVSQMYTLAA